MFLSRVCCTSKVFISTIANVPIVHAASLNFRDLAIPKGKYPFPIKEPVVPGSDGAGTVESVGKHVTRFKAGGTYSINFNYWHPPY
jgi:NADPH:quinone reductase-like Zn-dependent oxidoreductase